MDQTSLRHRLYPEFARIGAALGSNKRLELIDLLAQAPRNVEALARETKLSVASVSQHLQVLRGAKLVEVERRGVATWYRLADESVLRLWLTLQSVGETLLPEVDKILRLHKEDGETVPLSREELEGLLRDGSVFLIDVRPPLEYEHGHLPGAVSFPLAQLLGKLDELPRDRRIVSYCRGMYCEMSNDAERLLREEGFDVVRLEGGWPEWSAEGRSVSTN